MPSGQTSSWRCEQVLSAAGPKGRCSSWPSQDILLDTSSRLFPSALSFLPNLCILAGGCLPRRDREDPLFLLLWLRFFKLEMKSWCGARGPGPSPSRHGLSSVPLLFILALMPYYEIFLGCSLYGN